MFLLDDGTAGGCSESRERKEFTQRAQRKRTEFTEKLGGRERGRFIVPLRVAGEVGGAEVEVGVEFAFEEGGAAFGVADVFGGVATHAKLDGYCAALEGGAEILDAL